MITKRDIIERYNDYCEREFGDDPISENTKGDLGLLYTDVGTNEEYSLQVSYNLESQEIIVELTEKETGEKQTYKEKEPYEKFYDELEGISYDDYYSWAHDIVNDKFGREDIEF